MAKSLEVRVPLVDVDLINAISPLMFGPTKPDKKTMAKTAWNKVPSKILKRPKTGFSIPTNEWIYKEAEMKERGLRGWARVVYREAGKLRPIH
jgi:asparagine synthase (glutamine-hydrolysing)